MPRLSRPVTNVCHAGDYRALRHTFATRRHTAGTYAEGPLGTPVPASSHARSLSKPSWLTFGPLGYLRPEVGIPDQNTAESRLTARRLGVGDKVGARYRLEEVAGRGGMATVWRARDERLACTVAIKILAEQLAADAGAVARFTREARTQSALRHPNLVPVLDYSICADRQYLVLEYIAGPTLSERVDRGGLTSPAIHRLARELLSAIAWVHDQGVLHRDLKPGNVLIDRHGSAHLIDFGCALAMNHAARFGDAAPITRSGKIVGTPRFIAPELLEGSPSTRRSDLYAVGVLLRIAVPAHSPDGELRELIASLTQPDPRARPRDAHAALVQLEAPGSSKPVKHAARI